MKKAVSKSRGQTRTPAHRTSRTRVEDDSPALFLRHMGKSLLISLGIGLFWILAAALAAYFYSDPDSLILPLALLSAALTALCGGFAAVRIHGHSALLCGLCNGSLLTAAMILASLFFRSYAAGYSPLVSFLIHTAFIALSVVGAFAGLKKKKK